MLMEGNNSFINLFSSKFIHMSTNITGMIFLESCIIKINKCFFFGN